MKSKGKVEKVGKTISFVIGGRGGDLECYFALYHVMKNGHILPTGQQGGLIFPSFDGKSNIFATFIEQKSYRWNRKANDYAQLRHFCRENL